MTKSVLAPENLGAEFDVGVEEEDMVHVRTGRGLWRDSDVLESIPWKPEERWQSAGVWYSSWCFCMATLVGWQYTATYLGCR